MRSPFQGVLNIIRFNWHFYVLAIIGVSLMMASIAYFPPFAGALMLILSFVIVVTIVVSLFVSHFVYDRSDLYEMNWATLSNLTNGQRILNVHAGFDEVTPILQSKFPSSSLEIFDFYDPLKHTEVSIKRARKIYPPYPETKSVATNQLPLQDNSIDTSIVFLSAHEVRNEEERILFFQELRRVTQPNGQVIVTEHLRDINNFLAYTIGFLHFHSLQTWKRTFTTAGFKMMKEIKTTPFVTTFILESDGSTN
jgi:ubiquinone/menaquinone biosynthesis C-methylase UbiE